MTKARVSDKGSMTINGHEMSWEIIRSDKPEAGGIEQSRITELNLYRDGTMTADYNRKWIRVPYVEDEESPICINYLIERYGRENPRKKGAESA